MTQKHNTQPLETRELLLFIKKMAASKGLTKVDTKGSRTPTIIFSLWPHLEQLYFSESASVCGTRYILSQQFREVHKLVTVGHELSFEQKISATNILNMFRIGRVITFPHLCIHCSRLDRILNCNSRSLPMLLFLLPNHLALQSRQPYMRPKLRSSLQPCDPSRGSTILWLLWFIKYICPPPPRGLATRNSHPLSSPTNRSNRRR